MSVVGNFNYRNPDKDAVPVQLEKPLNLHSDEFDNQMNDPTAEMTTEQTVAHRSAEIGQLARQLTRQSTRTADNLFDYTEGSDLDPFSENFNAKKYVKSLGALSKSAGYERLSGVSYKNLSVHGYGSDAGK